MKRLYESLAIDLGHCRWLSPAGFAGPQQTPHLAANAAATPGATARLPIRLPQPRAARSVRQFE